MTVRSEPRRPSGADVFALAGAILTTWTLLLAFEHLAIGFGYRRLFAAAWEMGLARNFLSPILLAALTPVALAFSFSLLHIPTFRTAPRVFGAVGFAFGAAVAWGVTYGRHFQSLPLRLAFVVALSLGGAFLVGRGAFRFFNTVRSRPSRAAALSAAGVILAWTSDAKLLPRLYPAFHEALFALLLLFGATFAFSLSSGAAPRAKIWRLLPLATLFGALLVIPAARALAFATNLRFILADRAPFLGRAVSIVDRLASTPDSDVGVVVTTSLPSEVARRLRWENENVLLITIDALRADHVGAYGYSRPTTPAIDALAAEGALFESAYCPTPHTSYSVTSMMTGKYMRPLMNHGLGDDSELLAGSLRRYGFKTAAFYPPAVFFIDGDRFRSFSEARLGFEYARIEFGSPELRTKQIAAYLEVSRAAPRVFLWVHLFEPHEPYVRHPEHAFGERHIDDYDSEIRAADDGVGEIVRTFRAARPNTAVVVTADHGEEFGDHGGNYHGTTVFEEQVRVPLVIVGPGVKKGLRHAAVVQTIDLFPTITSAVGIPRDPRVLGRDLGSLLAGDGDDVGLAYSETDAAHLVAVGSDRLICARASAGACALYDVKKDPGERVDEAPMRPQRRQELVALRKKLFDDLARYEPKTKMPTVIHAATAGDLEAANEVLSLLDDANSEVRVAAAYALFSIASPQHASRFDPTAALRRALAKEENDEARSVIELALLRTAPSLDAAATSRLLNLQQASRDARLARAATFVLGEHGDGRGVEALLQVLRREGPPAGRLPRAEFESILYALARARTKPAISGIIASFVALDGHPEERKLAVEALRLAKDGDVVPRLLESFERERYVDLREREARALLALGAGDRLLLPVRRFAGMPDGSPAYLDVAEALHQLVPERGGYVAQGSEPVPSDLSLRPASKAAQRLLIELREPAPLALSIDDVTIRQESGTFFSVLVGPVSGGKVQTKNAVKRLWLVERQDELPPPAPEPWDGGAGP